MHKLKFDTVECRDIVEMLQTNYGDVVYFYGDNKITVDKCVHISECGGGLSNVFTFLHPMHKHESKLMFINKSQYDCMCLSIDDYNNYVAKNELLLDKHFYIVSDYPKLEYSRILSFLKSPYNIEKNDDNIFIHHTASVDPKAIIGKGSYISANVSIGDRVIIGNNCFIQEGAVVGSWGYSFVKNRQGNYEDFPYYGRVIIGDNVRIGANTVIDYGTIDDTVIENYAKIDNLCHIGHNCKIGKNCLLVANTVLGGGVQIGDNCWIAPSSVVRDRIDIAENSFICLGAVVIRPTQKGEKVFGNPAKLIGSLRRMPEWIKMID